VPTWVDHLTFPNLPDPGTPLARLTRRQFAVETLYFTALRATHGALHLEMPLLTATGRAPARVELTGATHSNDFEDCLLCGAERSDLPYRSDLQADAYAPVTVVCHHGASCTICPELAEILRFLAHDPDLALLMPDDANHGYVAWDRTIAYARGTEVSLIRALATHHSPRARLAAAKRAHHADDATRQFLTVDPDDHVRKAVATPSALEPDVYKIALAIRGAGHWESTIDDFWAVVDAVAQTTV
jgi:hypothetical protein